MMLARRRCAPCSAHFACPAYLARLALEWWWLWWIDLFIQPYTDPWILTAAGLFYIYDRNPVPGPPLSSSISLFLLLTSASSSDGRWEIVTMCPGLRSLGSLRSLSETILVLAVMPRERREKSAVFISFIGLLGMSRIRSPIHFFGNYYVIWRVQPCGYDALV